MTSVVSAWHIGNANDLPRRGCRGLHDLLELRSAAHDQACQCQTQKGTLPPSTTAGLQNELATDSISAGRTPGTLVPFQR